MVRLPLNPETVHPCPFRYHARSANLRQNLRTKQRLRLLLALSWNDERSYEESKTHERRLKGRLGNVVEERESPGCQNQRSKDCRMREALADPSIAGEEEEHENTKPDEPEVQIDLQVAIVGLRDEAGCHPDLVQPLPQPEALITCAEQPVAIEHQK